MNIENAKRRLLDSDQELSYSQRVAIVDLLEHQQKEIDRNYVIIGNYLKTIIEHTEYTLKQDKIIHEQQQEIERLTNKVDELNTKRWESSLLIDKMYKKIERLKGSQSISVEETTESLVRNLLTPIRFYIETGENRKQAKECIREIDRVCGNP